MPAVETLANDYARVRRDVFRDERADLALQYVNNARLILSKDTLDAARLADRQLAHAAEVLQRS